MSEINRAAGPRKILDYAQEEAEGFLSGMAEADRRRKAKEAEEDKAKAAAPRRPAKA